MSTGAIEEQVGQIHTRTDRWETWKWSISIIATMAAVGLIPLLFNGHYYYSADTSQGAYGNWYFLGSQLLEGNWPALNLSAWASGNMAAEAQIGLFSPLSAAIGVGSVYAANVVVYASFVKIAILALGALGVMFLARTWDVRWNLAYSAGVLAATGGFTLYMDAPSWSTNLMIWAIFPWVWWGLRRIVRGGNPLYALVPGYLLVTVGYVHGTIMLAVLVVALIVELALKRDIPALLRVILGGGLLALVAVAVYLPGVLTAGVTERSSTEITNTGFMVVDMTGLASSAIPTALPQITGWWGTFAPGPLLYTSWILPLACLINVRRLAPIARDLVALGLVGAFALLFVLGPSDVGPLRYPARLMPFVVTSMVLVIVIGLSKSRSAEVNRTRLFFVAAWIAVAGYLAFAQQPDYWKRHAVAALLVAGLAAGFARIDSQRGRASVALAILVGGGTLGVVALQHVFFDGRETSSANDYPEQLSSYQDLLEGGVNDGIVIGDPSSLTSDELFDATLVANTWYLNPHVRMQNVYTTIFFSEYSGQMCLNHVGATCVELLDRLFAPTPELGAPLVDLLAIDTIQVLDSTGLLENGRQPPPGWHVAESDSLSQLWVRDTPQGPAGSVVWTTPGVQVDVLSNSSDHVELRIEETEAGGEVVLSRLNWPGYRVSGAELASPAEGFLVTLDVGNVQPGEVVVVSFRPPGWSLSVGALAIALLGSISWISLSIYRASRPRSGL